MDPAGSCLVASGKSALCDVASADSLGLKIPDSLRERAELIEQQ